MEEKEIFEIRTKILEGISLSFRRLVEEKKKNDEDLVFSKNGKIIKIKAREFRDDKN
ncbi:MAG: hypothetical protein LBG80_06875 [Bacteroidales bacterium]|jgi:hypothetical protein|nr:hypothetical protein [Bacteroidales bacterium]